MVRENAAKNKNMKVTIGTFTLAEHDFTSTPAGHQATTLKSTAVSDFRINREVAGQIAEFVRAAQVKTFDRKNRKTSISFSVAREHTTIRNCEAWILEHSTKLPNSGLVTLQAKSDSGASSERYLQDAVLVVAESHYEGASSFHTYQIIGGDILTEKPKTT